MGRLKIVQITEEDKNELSELGYEALEATHAFLECLDKVTEGQISEEMRSQYGKRRGVPGPGRGRYGRRGEDGSNVGMRRGVAGTGKYGRHHYDEDGYDEDGYDNRDGGYGNRYDY